MRSIEVSTEVFAAIWAARKSGEETEDQILARVLAAAGKNPGRVAEERIRSSVKWIEDITDAMGRLGGRATYADLYRVVREIREAAGRTLPPSTDAIIRREVENHSTQSEAYTGGQDLFYAPEGLGAGVWALKKRG